MKTAPPSKYRITVYYAGSCTVEIKSDDIESGMSDSDIAAIIDGAIDAVRGEGMQTIVNGRGNAEEWARAIANGRDDEDDEESEDDNNA